MLTISQKEVILRSAGVQVRPYPRQLVAIEESSLRPPLSDSSEHVAAEIQAAEAVIEWEREIQDLYTEFVAHRAAKSLRDAEARRTVDTLRRNNE